MIYIAIKIMPVLGRLVTHYLLLSTDLCKGDTDPLAEVV